MPLHYHYPKGSPRQNVLTCSVTYLSVNNTTPSQCTLSMHPINTRLYPPLSFHSRPLLPPSYPLYHKYLRATGLTSPYPLYPLSHRYLRATGLTSKGLFRVSGDHHLLSLVKIRSPAVVPIDTPSQHTLSTHPVDTPFQHTLSTHPLNTPSQHTFIIQHTPYQHTL